MHAHQTGLRGRYPWLLRYISETSGTTLYSRASYRMPPGTPLKRPLGRQNAFADCDVSLQEYTGPRLTYQDIQNISREPNLSLMWIDRISGLSPFQGWFPMRTEWPISKSAHDNLQRERWPAKSEATIEIETKWPSDNEETITPDTHPLIAPTQAHIDANEKLRSLERNHYKMNQHTSSREVGGREAPDFGRDYSTRRAR